MKRWLVIAGLLVALSSYVLAQAPQKSAEQSPKLDEEITKLVRNWLDAEATGDTMTLNRLFADDFIGTSFNGNLVYKDDVVPQDGGGGRLPKSTLKDTTVRGFGTTAVAMGRVELVEQNPGRQFRFTLIFVKRQPGWQVVAAHLTHLGQE